MRFTAPFDWYEGETLGPGPEAPLRQDSPVASAIPLTLETAEPYRFAPAELVVYGRQLKSALEPDQVRERVCARRCETILHRFITKCRQETCFGKSASKDAVDHGIQGRHVAGGLEKTSGIVSPRVLTCRKQRLDSYTVLCSLRV